MEGGLKGLKQACPSLGSVDSGTSGALPGALKTNAGG